MLPPASSPPVCTPSQFILLFVAKVLTGKMSELSDVREYEEEGEPRKVPFVSEPDANG